MIFRKYIYVNSLTKKMCKHLQKYAKIGDILIITHYKTYYHFTYYVSSNPFANKWFILLFNSSCKIGTFRACSDQIDLQNYQYAI